MFSKAVKDQFVDDFIEVKDDLHKSAVSGKNAVKKELKKVAVKSSHKTEKVITYLEKQLAILKEKNRNLQQTTA